jgi:hypothetical protein
MRLNIQNMLFKMNFFEQKIRIFLYVLIIMNTFYLQLYLTSYKLQLINWVYFMSFIIWILTLGIFYNK